MSQSEYWTGFLRRRMSRRHLLKMGAAAGVGLGVGSALGCNSGSSTTAKPGDAGQNQGTAAPQKGGIFRYLSTVEYAGLDPYVLNHFADPVYERLIKYSPKRDKFLPSIAESWEIPDDKTYIFKIKKGVKFHNVAPVNGREVTAEDAKFSAERALLEGTQYFLRPYFTTIDKIEVIDKYTLKITTQAPFAPLMSSLALQNDFVMPKEIVGSDGIATQAIGTGPFMFDQWNRGEKLSFKRNPDYHMPGQPLLDGVEMRFAADYTTAVAVFLSDQTDSTVVYAQDSKTIREKRPKAQLLENPSLTSYRLFFRSGFKPTDDIRVRQAMDLMIHRPDMTFRIAGGTGEPFAFATGPLPIFLENWALPMSELQKKPGYMEKYPKDDALAQAKKLMAEAGYADGFDLELSNTTEQYRDMTVAIAQEWWKQIGIRTTIKMLDRATFLANGAKGDFQAMLWVIGNSDPDPDGQLYNYFRSGSVGNWSKWSDPTLDKMLDDQRAMIDQDKRKAIVLDAQRRVVDQVASLWLYTWFAYNVVSEKVQNLPAVRANGFRGWDYLGEVWLAK